MHFTVQTEDLPFSIQILLKLVTISDKIYMFCRPTIGRFNRFADLNPATFELAEFVPTKGGHPFYYYNHHNVYMDSYNDNIVIYIKGASRTAEPSKLHMINVNTKELQEIILDYFPVNSIFYDAICVLEDQLYIFSKPDRHATIDLSILNLKTQKWILLNKQLDIEINGKIVALVYNTDVYYCGLSNGIYLYKFDAINQKLIRVCDKSESGTPSNFRASAAVVKDDEFLFVMNDEERKKHSYFNIFNVKSEQWTMAPFKVCTSPVTITNSCMVDCKMFMFECLSEHPCRYPLTNINYYRIHVVDALPSLQTLCEVVIVKNELDSSKLPEILQDMLKRYSRLYIAK